MQIVVLGCFKRRHSNVIKRHRYWSKINSVLAGKMELILKTIHMSFMFASCLFEIFWHAFLPLLKPTL